MGNGARLNDLERGAWVGFLRAHHVLVAELDDELRREHDLPLTSFDVLVQLDLSDAGQLRMSELADAVLLSRSGLTRLVERLPPRGRTTNDATRFFPSSSTTATRRLAGLIVPLALTVAPRFTWVADSDSSISGRTRSEARRDAVWNRLESPGKCARRRPL